ncbi:macrophage expressed protein [Plakobranchus ocellatus]|uniref:Macrophage expressed protein n=1 Tax=Plakobranchus ocellatus TaxID=259542 RepID=A0AAV4CAQ1_9GAST|nr:macrophage expressed protein [Plakobranchus ocellatus]
MINLILYLITTSEAVIKAWLTAIIKKAGGFRAFIITSHSNPLAFGHSLNSSSLMLHTYSQGPEAWPRRCPRGYSQHMTAFMIEDGCDIYHCIQPNKQEKVRFPKLRRPPFTSDPGESSKDRTSFVYAPEHTLLTINTQNSEKLNSFSPVYNKWSSLRHGYEDRIFPNIEVKRRMSQTEEQKQETQLLVVFHVSQTVLVSISVVLILMFAYVIRCTLRFFCRKRKELRTRDKHFEGFCVKN